MISVFALLSLANALIVYSMGGFVFLEDRKGPENRIFAVFAIVLSLWAFTEFMYRQAQSYSVAYLWVRVFSFTWPLSTPVFLHFILLYTGNLKVLKHGITYVLLYLPAVLTTILDNIDPFTAGPVRAPWGYKIGPPDNILLFSMATAWVGVLGLAAVVLVWLFHLKTDIPLKKRQSLLIGIGCTLTYIAGAGTQMAVPLLGISIPELTSVSFTFLVVTVAVAVSRYRLLGTRPELAMPEILTTMAESVLLLDAAGRLLSVNKTTIELLEYQEGELVGKPAGILFKDESGMSARISRVLAGRSALESYRTDYRSRSDQVIPIIITLFTVKDKRNNVIGAIGIASDIRELIEGEEARGIADFLQRFLLSTPDRIEGITFNHLYRSATETTLIGGDFYDIFLLGEGRAGILIGDVSGKGLQAATVTLLVRNAVKAYAYEDASPASIMSRTNRTIEKNTSSDSFVTVFFGILDIHSGLLTYCNAGHTAAAVRSEQELSLLAANSPVIGAFSDLVFTDDTLLLRECDILLLYTDGIVEARRDGDFYDEERLVGFLRSLKTASVTELPQQVYEEVMRFTGGKLSDDIALLSLALSAEKSEDPG